MERSLDCVVPIGLWQEQWRQTLLIRFASDHYRLDSLTSGNFHAGSLTLLREQAAVKGFLLLALMDGVYYSIIER